MTSLADPVLTPSEDRRISRFQADQKERHADLSETIRTERRSESLLAAAVIAMLLAVLLYFTLLVLLGVLFNWDQRTISFWLGMIFFLGATMMTVYRKHYQRDIIIAKKRHKKTIPATDLDWWRFK